MIQKTHAKFDPTGRSGDRSRNAGRAARAVLAGSTRTHSPGGGYPRRAIGMWFETPGAWLGGSARSGGDSLSQVFTTLRTRLSGERHTSLTLRKGGERAIVRYPASDAGGGFPPRPTQCPTTAQRMPSARDGNPAAAIEARRGRGGRDTGRRNQGLDKGPVQVVRRLFAAVGHAAALGLRVAFVGRRTPAGQAAPAGQFSENHTTARSKRRVWRSFPAKIASSLFVSSKSRQLSVVRASVVAASKAKVRA